MNKDDRHAFLIMAHKNFKSLELLIKSLDYEDNDIFIHIDKKVPDFDETSLRAAAKCSNIYFVRRINVYWCHVSQIYAEYELFKAAFEKSGYRYYHLISGDHLALTSQVKFHEIFKEENRLWIDCHEENQSDPFLYKVDGFNHPIIQKRIADGTLSGLCRLYLTKAEGKIFRLIDIANEKTGYSRLKVRIQINGEKILPVYYKGNQWVSLPADFVKVLIDNEKSMKKRFRFTECSDEIFIPTLAYNTGFESRINKQSNTLVDWERGRPYTFQECDLEELKASSYLFARKVHFEESPNLVTEIMKLTTKD